MEQSPSWEENTHLPKVFMFVTSNLGQLLMSVVSVWNATFAATQMDGKHDKLQYWPTMSPILSVLHNIFKCNTLSQNTWGKKYIIYF